jgi:hypothetical protein
MGKLFGRVREFKGAPEVDPEFKGSLSRSDGGIEVD